MVSPRHLKVVLRLLSPRLMTPKLAQKVNRILREPPNIGLTPSHVLHVRRADAGVSGPFTIEH